MSIVRFPCIHCGKETPVELGKGAMTKQRCKHCGNLVGDADMAGVSREAVVRKEIKSSEFATESERKAANLSSYDTEGVRDRKIGAGVILTALFVLAMIGGILWYLRTDADITGENISGTKDEYDKIRKALADEELKKRSLNETIHSNVLSDAEAKEAREVLEAALAATTAHELLAFCRNPSQVKPLLTKYYNKHPGALPLSRISLPNNTPVVYMDDLRLASFFIIDPLAQIGNINVVRDLETSQWQLDWESLHPYSELDGDGLMEQRPTSPKLLRVAARHGDYYNFQFNEKEHLCVELSDLSKTFVINGYAKRDSPVAKKLLKQLPERVERGLMIDLSTDFDPEKDYLKGDKTQMTVRVKYPETNVHDTQVEIVEVIGQGWYQP